MNEKTPQLLFKHWIKERHAIYLRRHSQRLGVIVDARLRSKPWTDDPILGAYRFCNVYRQLDKVTVWLNENYYPRFKDVHKPFAACVARLINDIGALEALLEAGLQHSVKAFDWKAFEAVLEGRKAAGLSVRGAAYIVSTNGRTRAFPGYIAEEVLLPLWELRATLTPGMYRSLEDYARHLQTFMGIASFIAGQIVADLKYVHPDLGAAAMEDWCSFVVPGPGSKRGLNRLHGLPHDTAMSDKRFHDLFGTAYKLVDDVAWDNDWPAIHAQDVQNCLCEFDKYMRAYTGQGKPKQRY